MITKKTPNIKQSVGAQYICFATNIDTKTYSADVEKTEVVKSVETNESSEATPIYASGKLIQNVSSQGSAEISIEVIAFVAETLAKMRAETVETGGLVLSGSGTERPYFAYGKVVKLQNGKHRFEWFPKCQLTTNTDSVETSEGSFKEQNDTLTVTALPFDDFGNIKVYVQSDMATYPTWLTEDLFFSKPVLDQAMLTALETVPEG